MRIDDIVIAQDAKDDLIEAKSFYDSNEVGIGDYFFDNIISEIESLKLSAGIHFKSYGLYRLLARRFPYAIYYDILDKTVVIVAVLDLRRDPKFIKKQISARVH